MLVRILTLAALAMLVASPALAADRQKIVTNSPVPISVKAPKGGSEINIIVYPPDTSTSPSKGTETPDYIDNALSIAQSAQSSMSNTLTALTIIVSLVAIAIAVLIARGFFNLRTIGEIYVLRDEFKNTVKDAKAQTERLKALHESYSKMAEEVALKESGVPRTEEEKALLAKAASSLELLEVLGQKLTPEDYFSMAYDYDLKGDFKKANEFYDKSLNIKPNYIDALINKGIALEELGRFDEALETYDKALHFKPDDYNALSNKCVPLISLGRYDEVIESCNKALTIKPGYSDAYYNRACAYALMGGEREKALSDLKKAIELDERHRVEARDDEDFESLRDDPEFRELVGLSEKDGAEDTNSS